ncbi:MAG TPA: hypothetical protein VJ824_12045 [Bacillota bacterium]|nr:hypothetical protein [Bacillota bacterium]
MRKLILSVTVILFILVSLAAVKLNDRKVISPGDEKINPPPIETLKMQELHKRKLPYRDDADYSDHGNDLFYLEK